MTIPFIAAILLIGSLTGTQLVAVDRKEYRKDCTPCRLIFPCFTLLYSCPGQLYQQLPSGQQEQHPHHLLLGHCGWLLHLQLHQFLSSVLPAQSFILCSLSAHLLQLSNPQRYYLQVHPLPGHLQIWTLHHVGAGAQTFPRSHVHVFK